jgi:hypothetical protein
MELGPRALLFLFHSFERELHARRALEPIEGLVIATSYTDAYEHDPLGPVWLPVSTGSPNARRPRRLKRSGEAAKHGQ